MNPKVDEYLGKAKKWQEEMEKLRMIILDCQLTEELKWYESPLILRTRKLKVKREKP
jgi:uncharacterized protein YdeI (YjbR/CyaY-like superfamily)